MTTPLSLSISPAAVHLPATQAGISPYQGQVTITDNGNQPVQIHLSALRLTGCSNHGQSPWLHIRATDLTLKPHQPMHVVYTVDGGASGQAAVLASATAKGTGNVHESGAVGMRVEAATATTHPSCALAAPKPPAQPGSLPLWLAIPIVLALVLVVLGVRRLRRHRPNQGV